MTTFDHPPRILFLYGSLRECSYSRLVTEESARILQELAQVGYPLEQEALAVLSSLKHSSGDKPPR